MASYDFEFYETGTISVTAGQTAFTGSGTAWQLRGVEGALVAVSGAGATAFVSALSTDNQGEFRRAWSGPTLVDAQYTMWLPSAVAATALANHQRLAEIIASIQIAQPANANLSALAALAGELDHLLMFTSPTTLGLLPKSELATGQQIADIDTALTKRLRVDGVQTFTPAEILQGLVNIGALAVGGKAADSALLDGKAPAQLPVSTAMQAALNAKASLGANIFTGMQEIRAEVPTFNFISPSGTVGYRVLANITDTADFGFEIGAGYTGGVLAAFRSNGIVTIPGTLEKGGGSFLIDHPLDPFNKDLAHGFIEGPEYVNIYRGEARLVNGRATVNIDEYFDMMIGTFWALNADITVSSLQNQDSFARVRPLQAMSSGIFEIICEDETNNDLVAWMVTGRRKDPFVLHMDPNCERGTGRFIAEREKKDV